MAQRFMAIGECMVEMAPVGESGTYKLGFAGDTFNTAWYLRRIAPDTRVAYLTRAGQDSVSDQFVSFLSDAGIDPAFVGRDPVRSLGLYLIALKNGERSFAYWRGQSAARALAEDAALLDAAFAGQDVLYFSGITLAILSDHDRATLLRALTVARARSAKVVFDPNLRSRLWPDAAAMCAAITAAAQVSDVVLPSYDDEATFFGDATPQDTLARYQAAGAATVIVKNGGGDILFNDGETTGTFAVAPLKEIVDSTAAGDSFNAGFLAAFFGGASVHDSVRAGSALARKVIAGRGALVAV